MVEDNNPVQFLVVVVMVLFQPEHTSARTEGCNHTLKKHIVFTTASFLSFRLEKKEQLLVFQLVF